MSRLPPRREGAYEVTILETRDLDDLHIDEWLNLEERALEGNAFLSPSFVLPAIEHLDGERAIYLWLIHKTDVMPRILVGVAVLEESAGSRLFPLPHLKGFRSRHSYLSGLLIHEAYADETLRALFSRIKSQPLRWNGVVFELRTSDGRLFDAMERTAAEAGSQWCEYDRFARSALATDEMGAAYLERISKSRKRQFLKSKRQLSEGCALNWRLVHGSDLTQHSIEAFLNLEHMGWKGEKGTSLKSDERNERFFRDVVNNFKRRDNVFFTELRLGHRVIASSSIFVSGRSGFSFKVGWNPDYRKWAPGMMNDIELTVSPHEYLEEIDMIDSGAVEGAYVDQLWKERRVLSTGIYPTTYAGRIAAQAVRRAKKLKRVVENRRSKAQDAISKAMQYPGRR